MCVVKTPETLSCGYFPHLDLPVLGPCCEHLAVTAVIETQHRAVHHHEIVFALVLEILANFAGEVVPHLDKAINASRDEELSIRRELAALRVRLLPKLPRVSDGQYVKQKKGQTRREQPVFLFLP